VKPRATVIGLGPAGSAFLRAYKDASGVDISRRYFKACGEAVPVETPLVDPRFVVDKVKVFRFYHWTSQVGEVAYAKPRWYIVDKERWVEALRPREVQAEKGDVVVKAGGPYQSRGVKITVVRAYVAGAKADEETVHFIFPREATGFYWVFPHGGVLNVGGGFLGVENPVPLVRQFVEKWLGEGRVLDVRGAPLTVKPDIVLNDGEGFRIGEAAGLVYPLTGEGIRPGILSALALAEALSTKKPLEEYKRRVKKIVRQVEFQRSLLSLAERLIRRGESLLELAEDGVLREYIEENLSAKTLFIALAKRPRLAAKFIAALIK